MNEEMKIIIKAVTDSAKKSIGEVKKGLEDVGKSGKSVSTTIGNTFKGIAKGVGIAITAIAAVTTALVALGKSTLDYTKQQAKLITAFQAVGASAEQAKETYSGFYRFLGDADKATEASSHLAKITTNQKDLAEWTKICQGVYATFGDSLPIEGLTEASNETLRVGKVTGVLADALNWAGVSEDDFNAKLATTNSLEEREALLRSTLNTLYQDASDIYEKNNQALLAYNESQANLDATMASAGQAVMPLMTALNNLGSAFFTALKPALDVIIPALSAFVNWITQGIKAVTSFFSAITGKSTTVKAFGEIGNGAKQITNNFNNATGGAKNLSKGLDGAEKSAGGASKAIEDAKKSTQGFDELNIVSSGNTSGGSSGGAGGGGASTPAYASGGGGAGGGIFDNTTFGTEVAEGETTANGFVENIKSIFGDLSTQLKNTFAPSITAWKGAFDTVKESINKTIPHVTNGMNEFKKGFETAGKYVLNTFVPDVVNSFSTNIAPIVGDTLGFVIEETGKHFEWIGTLFNDVSQNIVVPALDTIKTVTTDTFDSIGKAWEDKGGTLLSGLGKAFENIRKTFTDIYEVVVKPIFDKIKEVFDGVWENSLKPLVDTFVDSALEIGNCLLQLYNDFIQPIVDWIVNNIFPIIVDSINKTIEVVGNIVSAVSGVVKGVIDFIKGVVQFIVGVFTLDWKMAWEGIKNIFKGIWDTLVSILKTVWETIKGIITLALNSVENQFKTAWEVIKGVWSVVVAFFKSIWDGISGVFIVVGDWFKDVFTTAWDGIKSAWNGVKTFFSDIWSGIKQVFGNVATFFKDTFKKAWDAVKNVFSSGGKVFDGIKDGIVTAFKTIVNALITGINKVVKVPFEGLNKILSKLQSISIANIKPFEWLSWRATIPQIPQLAKGGIVDGATLAMIGEAGKEVVMPLENNTEWIDKLADRLATKQKTPTKIVLQIGETELGWATIGAINGITEQTGGLQLVL